MQLITEEKLKFIFRKAILGAPVHSDLQETENKPGKKIINMFYLNDSTNA
jgi:hypothetical protein